MTSTDIDKINTGQALVEAGLLGAVPRLRGLEILDPESITYDKWLEIGKYINEAASSIPFLIGDWINFGEMAFGDDQTAAAIDGDKASRYDVAHRITQIEVTTLQNYRSVCAKIARSRRRPELSFTAHAAIAPLPADEQNAWLEKAVKNGWSGAVIRAERAKAKAKDAPPPADDDDPEFEVDVHRLEIWARNVLTKAQDVGGGVCEVPVEIVAQGRAILGLET